MVVKRARRRTAGEKGTSSRAPAKAILRGRRFGGGERAGPARLSPRLTVGRRRMLADWLKALPPGFAARLPPVKIAAAGRLYTEAGGPAHAASFIPSGYLLLADSLFSRRGELGRIVYHELCHFLWPRLGDRRRLFEAAVAREMRSGARGELGYAAELAKSRLHSASAASRDRRWRHYVCESFCDTGAFMLLRAAGHHRRHSEWTLAVRWRSSRFHAWWAGVR